MTDAETTRIYEKLNRAGCDKCTKRKRKPLDVRTRTKKALEAKTSVARWTSITISTTEAIKDALFALYRTGYFGPNIGDAASEILAAGVRHYVETGWLERPRAMLAAARKQGRKR